MESKRRHRSRYFGRLGSGIALLLLLVSCGTPTWNTIECFEMDTYCTIQAQSEEAVLQSAVNRLGELATFFSRTDETATLATLNQQGSLQAPTDLFYDLLLQADTLCKETKGAFDPTLANLTTLWGFGTDHPAVPNAEEVTATLASCGIENLVLSQDEVVLQHGMQLDLGGIAKGYATDVLVMDFKQAGVENALISLGGNVYALGSKQGRPYTIGVADPEHPNDLLGTLSLTDKAVVTSGDYQRYFEADGVRYHHILDGKTGYPADSDLAAVTVVSDSATLADAYSTALFVMGLEAGLQTVSADDRLEAIFVATDGTVTVSSGLTNAFTPTQQEE